jgi:hypothetical protein
MLGVLAEWEESATRCGPGRVPERLRSDDSGSSGRFFPPTRYPTRRPVGSGSDEGPAALLASRRRLRSSPDVSARRRAQVLAHQAASSPWTLGQGGGRIRGAPLRVWCAAAPVECRRTLTSTDAGRFSLVLQPHSSRVSTLGRSGHLRCSTGRGWVKFLALAAEPSSQTRGVASAPLRPARNFPATPSIVRPAYRPPHLPPTSPTVPPLRGTFPHPISRTHVMNVAHPLV